MVPGQRCLWSTSCASGTMQSVLLSHLIPKQPCERDFEIIVPILQMGSWRPREGLACPATQF